MRDSSRRQVPVDVPPAKEHSRPSRVISLDLVVTDGSSLEPRGQLQASGSWDGKLPDPVHPRGEAPVPEGFHRLENSAENGVYTMDPVPLC